MNTQIIDPNRKYKRIFCFGCSFTNYGWPTWPTILALIFPDAQVFNYGYPGAGNMYIFSAINTTIREQNIDPAHDLIMVMWTNTQRMDHFTVEAQPWALWRTEGDFFNREDYPEDYDPQFCYFRDLNLISAMNQLLNHYYPNTITCAMEDLHLENFCKKTVWDDLVESQFSDILQQYKDCNIMDFISGSREEKYLELLYASPGHLDSHPFPTEHLKYLEELGFTATDEARKIVEEWEEITLDFLNKDYYPKGDLFQAPRYDLLKKRISYPSNYQELNILEDSQQNAGS